jgi:hypothetical protein
MANNHYKVVIVGGGVAGLYAAWRLCVDAKEFTGLQPSDILILEGSGKTGGRLFTKPLQEFSSTGSFPSNSGLRAELGGMRFLNYHLYVGYLARKLGLDYVPFPADAVNNWHLLRGTAMQSNPVDGVTSFANQTVYALAPQEKILMKGTPSNLPLSPGAIISNALTPIVGGDLPQSDGQPTLRQMVNRILSAQGPNGPLWRTGFWNLIVGNGQFQSGTLEVSNEAYEFFADAGAYDTVPANWNAATAVSIMAADFAADPIYYALTEGYGTLCDALVEQLGGVTIQTNSTVAAVNPAIGNPAGGYTVSTAGSLVPITADNVILALPPRALQLITLGSEPLQAIKDQLLQSSPVPLFKIFLVYKDSGDQPWWSSYLPGGISSLEPFTRMTTDLPMRQVYNFGTFTDGNETYSLLQVSYSDALKAGYWAGLMSAEPNQSIDTGIFANLAPITGTENQGSGYAGWTDGSPLSGHPLFSTVHSQFVTVLQAVAAANHLSGLTTPNAPIAGAAIDWATDPFGGGVNFWNVGVNVNTAYNQILNPNPISGQSEGTFGRGGLFITGEGYSLMQGWVEGALWTVEDALAKAYPGTWPAPAWIPSNNEPVPPPGN